MLAVAGCGAGLHVGQLADDGVGRVDARLCFGGAGFGAAAQPFDLGRTRLRRLFMRGLRFEIRFASFEKSAEVALDAQQAFGVDAVEFDDLGGVDSRK